MILALLLIAVGLLGPVASVQWREGRWLGGARWVSRQLSPQLLAGVPMAGLLVVTLGLSLLWEPAIVLVFLAAIGFLWALFSSATRPRHRPEP